MRRDRPIVLLGLMGAGKTSVGSRLAARLAVPLVDSDETLVRTTGSSARRFQADHGRRALHAAELQVLEEALASDERCVIAAAASIVDTSRGRDLVRSAHSVWLDVPVRVRESRTRDDDAGGADHRPPAPDPDEERHRGVHLAATADLVVAAARPLEVVVDEIEAWARSVWPDDGAIPAPGRG